MKEDICSDNLLEQQLALSAYVDALLTGGIVPADQPVNPEPEVEVEPEQMPQPQLETVAAVDGVPVWAATRFQALLFEVAGLTLAVPLVKLKGVVPNEKGLTGMPGQSQLFLGVTPYQGVQSKVVDMARFVLPPDRLAKLGEDISERTSQLVVIDEGRWALACSKIGDVVELESTHIKWRTAAGKRRWLAGTVIDQMCALLDIDELTLQLAEGMA